jgi:hypothetical protein
MQTYCLWLIKFSGVPDKEDVRVGILVTKTLLFWTFKGKTKKLISVNSISSDKL